MKKQFIRFISCVLVISIIVPMTMIMPVSAISDTEYNAEAISEAMEDEKSVAKAGDWGTVIYVDGLDWGYFHRAVQDHIVDKYKEQGMAKELPITYKAGQNDLPKGKKDGDKGRADLYLEIKDQSEFDYETTYIWEVKPASFSKDPKMGLGIAQLKGYGTVRK